MKLPISLLKRFLVTEASLEQIAATATAIGLEVDAIEDKSAALKPFVVAEILATEKHPQADKLQVCKVKSAGGMLQIVCGAPNARAGIKVALANTGTIIPCNRMEIKKSAVRGVESQGMLCSARELGLSEDHAGIMELPPDAVIGYSIVDVLGLGDPVLDINITANRGDCMGAYGIARDLAAAGLGKLKTLCAPVIADEKNSGSSPAITINIIDSDGCPAFIGRVIRGVKNGASPEWLRCTLAAAGMRPISALVDVTNYFSLAFGRPLHVYDLNKLRGNITVRCAADGEEMSALNGKTYRFNAQCCVIADDSGAVSLGGIMGGSSTAVDENTSDILLEVALFNPGRIARTGRALHIDSDARARFERGVDVGFLEIADALASDLILELCGGKADARVVAGELNHKMPEIQFDAAAINALGGTDIQPARMREILTALGFTFDSRIIATVPGWRHDVSQPADLAEEVLRIVGYDAIPLVAMPKYAHVSRPALDTAQSRISRLRRALALRGLHETYSWGFCSEAQAAEFGGQSDSLLLLNPISADLSVMRPNILPHLLDALKNNAARGVADAALFEVGAVFVDVSTTGQRSVAAGVRSGLNYGVHWAGSRMVDIFDVKADALAVLEAAGMDSSRVQVTSLSTFTQAGGMVEGNCAAWYHPWRSGALMLWSKGSRLGLFGELHPATLKKLGIDFPVFAFEVYIDSIPVSKAGRRKALAVSDFQAVTRDFAFVVDGRLAAAELLKVVQSADKILLRQVTIFDVYSGKGIEEGKKSIALTVKLQADNRTLTDKEIEAVVSAIIVSVSKVGATLR